MAECAGTYLLVLFGTGSDAAAVLTGAQVGLWQVAVVWGFGLLLPGEALRWLWDWW